MRKIEIALIAIILLTIALSLNNFPGASAVFLFLTSCLFLFNFVNPVLDKSAANSNQKALLFIFALVMGPVILGTLFIFMFWSSGRIMLYQGVLITFIATASIAYKYSKNKTPYYRTILIRTTAYFAWALVIALIPARLIYAYKYSESPNYAAYVKANREYVADLSNDSLRQIKNAQWDSVRNFIMYRDMKRHEAEKLKGSNK